MVATLYKAQTLQKGVAYFQADVKTGASAASPTFQRLWQGAELAKEAAFTTLNLQQIDLTAAQADLAAQQATLTAQQLTLTAQQATLAAQQITLAAQQAALTTAQTQITANVAAIALAQADADAAIAYLTTINTYNGSYMSVQIEQRIRSYIQTNIRTTFRGNGTSTQSTSGGGSPGHINIAHGKGATPDGSTAAVAIIGTVPYAITLTGVDSTNISVWVFDPTTGAGLSGVSVTVGWSAWFWDGYPAFSAPGSYAPPAPP